MKGYEFHSELGRGGFGTVHKVYKIDSKTGKKEVMACKVIPIKENKIKNLKNEISFLKKAKHRYIIKLFDDFIIKDQSNSTAYLFMEFADCDTLQQEISYSVLSNETAKRYFAQIATALVYLHRLKIAHKDLKPENILLVSNGDNKEVRVSDFGLSHNAFKAKEMAIKSGHFGGTRAYMAPEIVRYEVHRQHRKIMNLNYDPFRSDMWALGVCLYEMLCRTVPFNSSNLNQMLINQENKDWNYPKHMRNTIDPLAHNLIQQLLEPDFKLRIDPLGLLTHQWIAKQIDLTLVYSPKQLSLKQNNL